MRLITIDLHDLTTDPGRTQLVSRVTWTDKCTIDRAAQSLHMSTAEFTRMVLVQAARAIEENEDTQ